MFALATSVNLGWIPQSTEQCWHPLCNWQQFLLMCTAANVCIFMHPYVYMQGNALWKQSTMCASNGDIKLYYYNVHQTGVNNQTVNPPCFQWIHSV